MEDQNRIVILDSGHWAHQLAASAITKLPKPIAPPACLCYPATPPAVNLLEAPKITGLPFYDIPLPQLRIHHFLFPPDIAKSRPSKPPGTTILDARRRKYYHPRTSNLEPRKPGYPTIMASSSDLNLLLEMGFEKDRAELAMKKAGSRMSSSLQVSLPS